MREKRIMRAHWLMVPVLALLAPYAYARSRRKRA